MRFPLTSLLVVLLSGALACNAWARDVPADAKRAKLTHLRQQLVQLDDKHYRLAPGALIRDTQNIIVFPTMVPAKSEVKYQLDNMGMVRRVWILTPAEIAQAKGEEPVTKPAPKNDQSKNGAKDDQQDGDDEK